MDPTHERRVRKQKLRLKKIQEEKMRLLSLRQQTKTESNSELKSKGVIGIATMVLFSVLGAGLLIYFIN